jgi:hypothetical protein
MDRALLGFGELLQGPAIDGLMTSWRPRTFRESGRLRMGCGRRRARFQYRGVVKADQSHALCFECYRAERNRLRVRVMIGGGWLAPLAAAAPSASKSIGDRAGLYMELAGRRRMALRMARHALAFAAAQEASNGSFHCAVNSSRASEAAIESTGASAA